MRILLLSAYDAASHRRWRRQLVSGLDDWDWTVLALPPRHFAWRSRGNPISWAFASRDALTAGYDLVLATSMVELAELRGIVPALGRTPAVVYFHENQFAYPEQHPRRESQHYKLNNLYTALAADRVLFNSRYNRDTFLSGAEAFLGMMPDCVPPGIVEGIAEKSAVLSVPLEEACFALPGGPLSGTADDRDGGGSAGPLEIVWNHRWEYDKAPGRFFDALYRLAGDGVPFRVHVLGQRFGSEPEVFGQAREMLGERVATWGFVEDRSRYKDILARSDLAVSTALHDFQGLALLEAVAAGCLPLAPDRLAYRELMPENCRYRSFVGDAAAEVEELYRRLLTLCEDPAKTRRIQRPDLTHLSWRNLGPEYKRVLEGTAGQR